MATTTVEDSAALLTLTPKDPLAFMSACTPFTYTSALGEEVPEMYASLPSMLIGCICREGPVRASSHPSCVGVVVTWRLSFPHASNIADIAAIKIDRLTIFSP